MKNLKIRIYYKKMLTFLLNFIFRILQPLGIHICRNHFYDPIPDTSKLDNNIWNQPREILGIDFNVEHHEFIIDEIIPKYINECNFSILVPNVKHEYHFGNKFFESVDAEILHCIVRHYKPKQIIEIGSGYSTFITAKAKLLNKEKDNIESKLISIEPYPNETIKKGFPGLDIMIEKPIQEVELSLFENLNANDILFIDSSHVIKIGNDVIFEYSEILPRLKSGVLIQIHDIFLPDDYPKQWVVNEHKFWTEQYLLQSFLTYNSEFEIIWASSFYSLKYKDILEKAIPSWKNSHSKLPEIHQGTLSRDGENVWPVSLWMRRK